MNSMEWFIKIAPIVISFILPLLRDWINNLRLKNKENTTSLRANFDNAEDFEEIQNSSCSQLAKDRYAKILFNNENINNEEAILFMGFKDADYWVKRYLPVKYRVKIIRDLDGNFVDFESNYTWKKSFLWYSVYFLSMSIFATPYIFFKQYNLEVQQTIIHQNYLLTVELVLFPLFFLAIGILSINEKQKNTDAKNFVIEFKERAKLS